MSLFFTIIDCFCFVLISLAVIYLLLFALLSQRRKEKPYPPAHQYHRILVLFPAYREDGVIVDSVRSFFDQDYPAERYHVTVISDGMKQETDEQLRLLSAEVLNAHFENSSKAAALNLAIAHQDPSAYDIVVIMDADNVTVPDFLRKINDAYDSGIKAVQAHRLAKEAGTDVAILDRVSEEINNSIFRQGHVQAGLSSALIGSGMAFDYEWFVGAIPKVTSAGEDKELELLLLREEIFIEYLSEVFLYDEKISTASAYYRQRRRWIAAQFDLLGKGLRYLPQAIATGNLDFCDKIFQWLLPPRIVLSAFPFLMGIITLFVHWTLSLKWWLVVFLLLSAFSIAMPDELYNHSFRKALRKVPLLFLLTVINMFRTGGVNKKFIHTKHGGGSV